MLVFSVPGAPLSISQDATRAVNLLYCRSPGCVALGCLRETSEPGVRWSQGSSLNFELKLRHSASEKYLAYSVLGFTVSD